MSNDLDKLFRSKNKEILNNKIILDIDNNTDSLKLTLSNVISLEMNKLLKSLVKLCADNKLECSDNELNEIIEVEKKNLESIMLQQVVKRQQSLENIVKDEKKDLNKEELTRATNKMIIDINSGVGKEMAISLMPMITSKIKFTSEDHLLRMNGLVRLASNTIQNRVSKNTRTRLINLENVIDESINISDKFSKMTEGTITKINYNKKDLNKVKTRNRTAKKAA